MHATNTPNIDLNLLRVFDAVYRMRSVSRAAEVVGLSQPATSHAVTRLRLALRDPLFERSPTGMQPTERADRLARSVQAALAQLDEGLQDHDQFDPKTSTAELRLHLTDIGERRFLPRLMGALQERAPRLRVRAQAWAAAEIASALHTGALHFALGFLPGLKGMAKRELFFDRYVLMCREAHPALAGAVRTRQVAGRLERLDYVTVRSHVETLLTLQRLGLDQRVRLEVSHFLALPAIVRTSDLVVIVPREVAASFEPMGSFRLAEPGLPADEFAVAMHWSRRHEATPLMRWAHSLLVELFASRR